jgi:hypothetical protein
MGLLQDFLNVAREQGINVKNMHQEKGNGFTVVSFGEQGECNVVYNIALVFYDNNDDVEIFVRKRINDDNIVQVFNQVNNLNAEYRGVTFYLENGVIVLKSYIQVKGNVRSVLEQMVNQKQTAIEEFSKIK